MPTCQPLLSLPVPPLSVLFGRLFFQAGASWPTSFRDRTYMFVYLYTGIPPPSSTFSSSSLPPSSPLSSLPRPSNRPFSCLSFRSLPPLLFQIHHVTRRYPPEACRLLPPFLVVPLRPRRPPFPPLSLPSVILLHPPPFPQLFPAH